MKAIEEFEAYEKYITTLLESFKNPVVVVPAVGISITLNSYHFAIFLLATLLIVDYCTGVWASWSQWKKLDKETSFWKDKKDGFTSDRTRMSISKVVTYMLFILLTQAMEYVFKIKPFEFSWLEHEMTLTFISMGISCAIEFYSIIFENLPKAGFSIWDMFKKITGTAKNAVSEIKDITNGNDDHRPS